MHFPLELVGTEIEWLLEAGGILSIVHLPNRARYSSEFRAQRDPFPVAVSFHIIPPPLTPLPA